MGRQRFMRHEQILRLSVGKEQRNAVCGKTRRGQMPAYVSHRQNARQKNAVAIRRSVGYNDGNIRQKREKSYHGQKLPENIACLLSGLRDPGHRG